MNVLRLPEDLEFSSEFSICDVLSWYQLNLFLLLPESDLSASVRGDFLKWDMIQKLSAHMKLYIWCFLCPSRSKRIPIPVRTLNLGASTQPRRGHRSNENLLSTHSNIAWPSKSATSRKKAEKIHPCVFGLSINFATCLGLASSNAVLMPLLAKYFVDRNCLLPFPVFL